MITPLGLSDIKAQANLLSSCLFTSSYAFLQLLACSGLVHRRYSFMQEGDGPIVWCLGDYFQGLEAKPLEMKFALDSCLFRWMVLDYMV